MMVIIVMMIIVMLIMMMIILLIITITITDGLFVMNVSYNRIYWKTMPLFA